MSVRNLKAGRWPADVQLCLRTCGGVVAAGGKRLVRDCEERHGAPCVATAPVALGLNPLPRRGHACRPTDRPTDRENFPFNHNSVRMTAMAAFGASEGDARARHWVAAVRSRDPTERKAPLLPSVPPVVRFPFVLKRGFSTRRLRIKLRTLRPDPCARRATRGCFATPPAVTPERK